MMKKMKILFTGGGTGGHIYPIIAIKKELENIHSKNLLDFFYIGPKDAFAKDLLLKENVKNKIIIAGKVRRYISLKSILQNFIDIFIKMPIGFFQAFWHIFFLSPDIIFSKGGYGSLPVVICGWILRVPIFLHESDVIAGAVNRISAKFALEIFVSFPIKRIKGFSRAKIISVGNPINAEILKQFATKNKQDAIKELSITKEKPVILILGGSQGAQRINDKILEILPKFLKDFEIIHQTGIKNFKQIQAETKMIIPKELEKYYHIFPFLNEKNLINSYICCDIIVSRAGAGSIFEIAMISKPSILIPLPESAQNHQIKNSYVYAETGASIVIEESNFTPHFFLEKLRYLFSNPEKMKTMSDKAKEFSKPKAGNIIAQYLIEYLDQ